jgi:hypothetical protein
VAIDNLPELPATAFKKTSVIFSPFELKDIFWEWMKKTPFTYFENITELWSLLKERSNKFNTDEFNVVINWIKSIDMKEHSHFNSSYLQLIA